MERLSKQYKKALVIFIDILGSQNREDFDVLYKISDTFHSVLLSNKDNDRPHTAYKREIYTFSDCAYIIYDFKENVPDEKKDLGKLFEVALANCEPLLIRFLNEGFIFRGGIAYGDVYYEQERNLLFGPGINSAYKLESVVAKYPRIVVEDYVAETILEHWNRVVYEMGHPKTEEEIAIFSSFGNLKLMEGCVVKKDFDGTYMLHYLNAIETKVESISIIHTTNEKFIEKLRNLCVSEIKKNEQNPHIAQKYGWLLKYIDLVYDEVD